MEHTPEFIEKKIIALVAQNLNVDPASLTLDTNLIEDLDADSLDALTIALNVDREFGIQVQDSELASFCTCREIINAVMAHLNQAVTTPA
jgi:acyl carrier protein